MNTVITIIITVLIFGVLIAIHELGHYLVARAFGVGIREYSIGMGPKLFQKVGKYNKFTLRALPIGGYVDMVGENSDDDGSNPEDAGKIPLNTKPIWQRILIVLAGPLTNIVLGLLIMAILVLFQPNLYTTTIDYFGATAISDDSMVYIDKDFDNFKAGDIIYTVNGQYVNANDGIESFLSKYGTADIRIIRRNSISLDTISNNNRLNVSEMPLAVNNKGNLYLSEDFGEFNKYDIVIAIDDTNVSSETDLSLYTGEHSVTIKKICKDYRFDNVDLKTLPLAVSGRLMVGDQIKKVGRYNAFVYSDMSYGILNEGVEPVDIVVFRNGKEQTVENVVFHKISEKGIVFGNIDFAPTIAKKTVGSVLYNTVYQPLSSLKVTLDGIVQTFSGKYGIEALSGPVGIGEQIGQVIKSESNTIPMLFNMIVMITLSLGVCNLLPLPVLDGGRMLLYVIEAIRRKPLNAKVEQYIISGSMILVLALMAFVMFKDIIGFFK